MNTQNEMEILKEIAKAAPDTTIKDSLAILEGFGYLLVRNAVSRKPHPVAKTPAKETPAEETPVAQLRQVMRDAQAEEAPVAQLRQVMNDAQAEETPAKETPAEETPAKETPAEETPAEETPAEETPAKETPAKETPAKETPSLDEVRMLASYIVKNQEDFDGRTSSLGKTKLGACLKKVGAKSITVLFEGEDADSKIVEFVASLEKNAGKTLEQVVAETTA